MRNGNKKKLLKLKRKNLTFYPTYEEWKQEFLYRNLYQEIPFYPTYEEWKPVSTANEFTPGNGFLSYL